VVLFGGLCLLDVGLFLLNDVLFEGLLFLFHVFHFVLIVLIFLDLGIFAVVFNIHVGFFLFILQKFQFLQKNLDLSVVISLHMLPFSLLVENFSVCLLDLDFSVVVELLNHISIHLNVVPLGLDIPYFLLVKFEVGLKLGSYHFHELIIGLFLLLWFLGRHHSLSITYNYSIRAVKLFNRTNHQYLYDYHKNDPLHSLYLLDALIVK
jgi:hypothetical protein